MNKTSQAVVTTANGLTGFIDQEALAQTGSGELISVQLDGGQQLWVMPVSLIRQADGQYLLPVAVPQRANSGSDGAQSESETVIIPVMAEEALVSKRASEAGVRVSKVVHTREEEAQASLVQEDIDIRREPVNELVTEAEQARQEGDTWIVPVYTEELVVEKRLRLNERVYITKRQSTREQAQPVTLRQEEVVVEQLNPVAETGRPSTKGRGRSKR